jgi:shikimate dehydrogenase
MEQLNITGATRLLVLIGDPISSVRSPQLFNRLFSEQRHDAVCAPLHVAAQELNVVFAGLKAIRNLDGVLVTMPHKQAVLSLLDDVDDTARQVGSVSIVRREPDGRWTGAIFDGWGCVLGMRWEGIEPAGRRVLLMGAGGAGSAIAFAVAQAGARMLTISDVAAPKARQLADSVRKAAGGCETRVGPPDPRGYDIVINATPAGMHPGDPMPINPEQLDEGAAVVDIIIKPDPTQLCAAARERGCRVQSGAAMHEGQAVYATRFLGWPYWPDGRPKVALPGPS